MQEVVPEISWPTLVFDVPSMSADVYTTVKVGGKSRKVKKTDPLGRVLSTERVFAKERPRFTKKGRVFSSVRTTDFESHIRRHFFETYDSNFGVYYKKKPRGVHKFFLGCQKFGKETACTAYREGRDFLDCQVCNYRRKNLTINLLVYQKDDRAVDLDNMLKIVLDALNKVCYYDDAQFAEKTVKLVPYAKEEHLEVQIGVKEVIFENGSLIGGYNLKKLPVNEATLYLSEILWHHIQMRDNEAYQDFVRRCDNRKYVEKVISEVKENETNAPV